MEKRKDTINDYTPFERTFRGMGKIIAMFNFLKIIPKERTIKILDVGTSDFGITKSLANYFDVDEIWGTDIILDAPKLLREIKFKGEKSLTIKYQKNNGKTLNYSSNFFGLVCCFMTIHHFTNKTLMLDEIFRISKKYILIKEHDCKNEGMKRDIIKQHKEYGEDYDGEGLMGEKWYISYFRAKGFELVRIQHETRKEKYGNFIALFEKKRKRK
jgi:hypothetical protein